MSELFWTKKLPTEDGWYWWRRSLERQAQVVHLQGVLVKQAGWEPSYHVENAGGEWYGPLEEPSGDAIENCQ